MPTSPSTPGAPPEQTYPAVEADLIARLRAGDDAAYASLVEANAGRMLAVARRITHSDAEAQDAVQDAFLSAFKAIQTFDGRSTLATWLHRIVVNAALMRQRRAKAHPEASIEALLPHFENGSYRDRPEPWNGVTTDQAESIEAREAVWKALDQLPEEFRNVIVLRDIEGLESKAVATALGISDSLVRQRLHRGRLALMKLLEPLVSHASERGDE